MGPKSWDSGHPAGEPYRIEFVPLIRRAGGVRLFTPEISYEWFFPNGGATGDLNREEIKYLALLIRHAERQLRIPVFGFARSLGRMMAIKKQFPGTHIFQTRNLWTQWFSWIDHRQKGNDYFLLRLLRIMFTSKNSYFSSIVNPYLINSFPSMQFECNHNASSGVDYYEQLCIKLLAVISIQDLFVLYMAFHTYLYLIAQRSADIVVDTTKLVRDENYRRRARESLACVTGLSITFDGIAETQQFHLFDPALIDWRSITENLNFAVQTLDHMFDRQELLRYGTELLDETRAEIGLSEKYIFSARRRTADLVSERDSATAAISVLIGERDRLSAERDAVFAERDRLPAERDAAFAERDRLSAERDAAFAERDRASAERAAAFAECDRASAERDGAFAERDRLSVQRAATLAERDQIAMQSERWFNAAVVWAAGSLLSVRRSPRAQCLQRLMLRFRVGPIGWLGNGVNVRRSPRNRADRARDRQEWELAARFYIDELNRNAHDPAIWLQLGHCLKEAGKIAAADVARSKAATLKKD